MATYATKVRADIRRWVEAGFIDAATGDVLSRDVEASDRRSLSFGSILAVMAALLVGAAILIVVAANWETIPRIARVGALFATILAGYVGGALLKLIDQDAFAEALWLIAAAAFGASIALVGQMYHLSGDETEAVLVWCIGVAVSALVLRSSPLTIAAVVLATAWLFFKGVDFWRSDDVPHLFLALAAALWLVSYRTRSAAARHLLLLSLLFYVLLLAMEADLIGVAAGLAAASAALFAAAVVLPAQVERVMRINGLTPLYGLLGFLIGVLLVQIELTDQPPSFAVASALALAGIVAAVVLCGREIRGLRWLAYAGFALELCLVYAVLVGSMLGTAGFFLAAGLIVGVVAFAIIRIEKRMRATPQPAGVRP